MVEIKKVKVVPDEKKLLKRLEKLMNYISFHGKILGLGDGVPSAKSRIFTVDRKTLKFLFPTR